MLFARSLRSTVSNSRSLTPSMRPCTSIAMALNIRVRCSRHNEVLCDFAVPPWAAMRVHSLRFILSYGWPRLPAVAAGSAWGPASAPKRSQILAAWCTIPLGRQDRQDFDQAFGQLLLAVHVRGSIEDNHSDAKEFADAKEQITAKAQQPVLRDGHQACDAGTQNVQQQALPPLLALVRTAAQAGYDLDIGKACAETTFLEPRGLGPELSAWSYEETRA